MKKFLFIITLTVFAHVPAMSQEVYELSGSFEDVVNLKYKANQMHEDDFSFGSFDHSKKNRFPASMNSSDFAPKHVNEITGTFEISDR